MFLHHAAESPEQPKHTDLTARYGRDQIGLLTGDLSVNGNAPVVVMTTEVLRNMLYADSPALQGFPMW